MKSAGGDPWQSGFFGIVLDCISSSRRGGFFLTLRLDASEDKAAETLLKKDHLLVHPGHFYDLEPDHLILSFVQEPTRLETVLPQLVQTVDEL